MQMQWLTPLLQWTLVQSVTGLTVAFAPVDSPTRPIAAAFTAVVAYLLQSNIRESFAETRFAGPVVAMCWVNVLNAVDLLVLSRVSYDAQAEWENSQPHFTSTRELTTNSREVKKLKSKTSTEVKKLKSKTSTEVKKKSKTSREVKKLLWSIAIAYNYRRINTPWQINHIPLFNDKNPRFVPSKPRFLIQCTYKLCLSLLLVHLLTVDVDNPRLQRAILDLSQSKTVLLPTSWTARRLLTQTLFTVSFAIVTRAVIVAGYTVAAMASVALGISTPTSWPPVANSLAEAYSLRRFWGLAWHQTLRKLLSSNASFLVSALGIPPTTTAAYFLRLLFAFLASGAIHSLMDMAFGVPLSRTGGMWFFSLQVVGVAIELAFSSSSSPSPPSTRGKKMGYLWTGMFLLWVTPVWINPILVSLYNDGQRIPFFYRYG